MSETNQSYLIQMGSLAWYDRSWKQSQNVLSKYFARYQEGQKPDGVEVVKHADQQKYMLPTNEWEERQPDIVTTLCWPFHKTEKGIHDVSHPETVMWKTSAEKSCVPNQTSWPKLYWQVLHISIKQSAAQPSYSSSSASACDCSCAAFVLDRSG